MLGWRGFSFARVLAIEPGEVTFQEHIATTATVKSLPYEKPLIMTGWYLQGLCLGTAVGIRRFTLPSR